MGGLILAPLLLLQWSFEPVYYALPVLCIALLSTPLLNSCRITDDMLVVRNLRSNMAHSLRLYCYGSSGTVRDNLIWEFKSLRISAPIRSGIETDPAGSVGAHWLESTTNVGYQY